MAAKKKSKYTKPELRESIKKKVQKSSKGGNPGQWSARKAQLVAQEYKKRGGGYASKKKQGQAHLDQWTKEDWQTADKKKARRGKTTKRYLPKKAWDQLSAKEKADTEKQKSRGTARGKQYVGNAPAAKKARKKASKKVASKKTAGRKKAASKKKTGSTKAASKKKTGGKKVTKKAGSKKKVGGRKTSGRRGSSKKASGRSGTAKRRQAAAAVRKRSGG